MKTLIKNELRLTRRIQIIWLALMLLLTGFCYFEFLSLKDNLDSMEQMIRSFPRLLMIMFGVRENLNSAIGWYGCLYFWTGIIAFVYAMYLGISCVAREKQRGTSEYLFTKPVSRREIVLAKVIAASVQLAVFAAFTGICNYQMIILPMGGLEQTGAEITTTIGLFLTQLVFFAMGLLIASLARQYKSAIRIGTVSVLSSYGIAFVAEYAEIHLLDFLSPLRYFDVYEVTLKGFQISYLILAAVVVAVCISAAVKCWERREL